MRIESLIPLLVTVILVVVGYIAWYITVKRRSHKLREKYPPHILALNENVTDRYNRQWTKIQTYFGNPSQSVEEANEELPQAMAYCHSLVEELLGAGEENEVKASTKEVSAE